MTEILFFVTVIFVAYVVYSVTSDFKKSSASEDTSTAPMEKQQTQPQPKAPVEKVEKPVVATADPATSAESSQAVTSSAGKEVRNPGTGETATIPSNYRFTKRWIKDALVNEGLLDRVYKNTELDEATSEKVKEALLKFSTMAKYQP